MPIETYYRGVNFIKQYMVHYLNSIFLASAKGQILFTNGFKKIKFSATPQVIRRASWDFRNLPSVLIGSVRGSYKYMSTSKDYLSENTADDASQYRFFGGDLRSTLDMEVRATTLDEKENLTDIVCVYLAHPDAKDFFDRHAIVIEHPPVIGAERDIHEPNIDHPIYGTAISIDLISPWQIKEPLEPRLIDIVSELTLEVSLDL
jgi:hypothetical protein